MGQRAEEKGMRMLSLNQIRQELLVAREELNEDLATIERALQALGKPEEKSKGNKPKRPKERPSQPVLDATLRTVQQAERPLRTKEVAQETGKSMSQTVKALGYLREEGKITSAKAEGKGKAYVWSAVKDMEKDLQPARHEWAKS